MYFKSFLIKIWSAAVSACKFISTQVKQKALLREAMRLLIVSVLYFFVDLEVLDRFVRIWTIVERFL